jgi:hypothetical protein
MELSLQVALVSGGFAVLSTLLSLRNGVRTRQAMTQVETLRILDERRFQKEATVSRYREPLARAVYDLQSRLYNILRQNLIWVYFNNGDKREQLYVVENTVFLIAQYFAWTEIIRKHIQLLDLGGDEQTQRLAHLQDDMHGLFLTDSWGKQFRVFAGEQRAIGEKMIQESNGAHDCIGYASFLEADFGKTSALVDYLRDDVRSLAAGIDEAAPRLTAIQSSLIDLLGFLDPQFIRFPATRRTKLSAA